MIFHLEFVSDDPDERRETLDLVCDEHRRMRRLIDDLLVLARSKRPDFLELETVDLAAMSGELIAKARALGDVIGGSRGARRGESWPIASD